MNLRLLILTLLIGLGLGAVSTAPRAEGKKRILVVSSYHKDYAWSRSTQQGLVASMLDHGYLDSPRQGEQLTRTDHVESAKAVVRKEWMDAGRQGGRAAIAAATERIVAVLREFRPDLVLLGDDSAAKYIGNQLLDSGVPVVFWGINGLPLRYGLVESMDRPGHNVTGVWQQGYLRESLELLQRLVPGAKTFAILASDSETARPQVKHLQVMAREGRLPLELAETVVTNSFEEFKKRSLDLAGRVDAFFVLDHDTMTDARGRQVAMHAVGKWYLTNIRKPEAASKDQFVVEGMLLTANDYGYNQSYLAFEMAREILEQGMNPAEMQPRTPARGPLMVNGRRAAALGLTLDAETRKSVQLVPSTAAAGK